jgi:hypothetical protein
MYYSLVANHQGGADPGQLTGTFVAAQTNRLELTIDQANTILETNEANNSLTKTIAGVTPTPSPASGAGQSIRSFAFFVSIAGITRNRGMMPMQVEIGRMGSSAVLYTATAQTTYQRDNIYQGVIVGAADTPLPEAAAGNVFWVTVKGPYHLRRAFTNLAIANDTLINLSGRRLEAGDLPTQDGYVNHKDINAMLEIIASPIQSRSDLDTADVNRDGRVNAIDFGLLLRGFAQTRDEVAP